MPRPKIDLTLRFCCKQADNLNTDPDAIRWLVVGLALALQEACVLALTGYDTAAPEDILTPGQDELAPIETLLRRVCSERYLTAPEKLGVGQAKVRAALSLYRARNQLMHGKPDDQPLLPDAVTTQINAALMIIKWLVVDHPAFADAPLSAASADALGTLLDTLRDGRTRSQ